MAYLKIRHRQSAGYTGAKYHDPNAIRDVLTYIFDPAKTPSGYIGGVAVDPRNAEHEMSALSAAWGQAKGTRLRHMILSFDKGELSRGKRSSVYFANM